MTIILEFVGTTGDSDEVICASLGDSLLPGRLKQKSRALLELECTSFRDTRVLCRAT